MNRPRNRNRNENGSSRGRGRGQDRGRGGGTGCRGGHPRQPYIPVPPSSQVNPGVGVSIILKIDQPTGRQVQGIVSEVLGRGDHPRGIKVRLVDGRVGRVQAIVSVEEAKAVSEGLHGLGRNGELEGAGSSHGRTARRPQHLYEDLRQDGHDYESVEAERGGPNLMDFVKVKPAKKSKGPAVQASGEETSNLGAREEVASTEMIKCPVCGEFEGDEGAVAFHVNTHFE